MTHNSLIAVLEESDLLNLWHLLFLQKQRWYKFISQRQLTIKNVKSYDAHLKQSHSTGVYLLQKYLSV